MLNGTQVYYDVISKKTKMKQSKAAVYATGLRPAFLSYPVSLSSADSVLTRCKYFYAN